MDVKIHLDISKQYKDIEVYINAPERNEEVQRIENAILQNVNKKIEQIIAIQDNEIFIINVQDIIEFFSKDKYNFCRTKDGEYIVKEKLYYLEQILPTQDFVRISNSVIINVNHVKSFNTSIIGKIVVKFKDGTKEDVSKRRTSEIMKFLKNRRYQK